MLGRLDDAVALHESALEVHERMGANGWVARSRYDLARALLARHSTSDAERAVGLVTDATAAARRLGMPKLLDELGTLNDRSHTAPREP